ncbi:MAG: hypothetical protein QM790_16435 [Nibricoccus sp.]
MNIPVNIGVFAAALVAIIILWWEALLLTVFSATREFWYAGELLTAAISMLALGVVLRKRVRKWLTMGASLFFSICAAIVLAFDIGLQESYAARVEISLPSWHFTVFTWVGMSFGLLPLLQLIKKEPNQTLLPTTPPVTLPAGQEPRQI